MRFEADDPRAREAGSKHLAEFSIASTKVDHDLRAGQSIDHSERIAQTPFLQEAFQAVSVAKGFFSVGRFLMFFSRSHGQ